MPFVVKNGNGEYGAGGGRWGSRWVYDLQEARVYLNRGAAVASIRATFSSVKHPEETIETVPVKVVEDGPIKQ